MAYIGSKDRLNSVVGVSEIIPLTTGLETEYGNKIFKANLIFKKESTGLLYISDGVTTLAALPAITDNVSTIINQHISNNNIHLTPEAATNVTNAINSVTALTSELTQTANDLASHIANQDLHLSAATIASTYATKAELQALSGVDVNAFVTNEEFDAHVDDASIHVSATTIANTYATKAELADHAASSDTTYATKAEVSALSLVYATKTNLDSLEDSVIEHVADNEVHLTSSDKSTLQSIRNSNPLQSYELDSIMTSIYS